MYPNPAMNEVWYETTLAKGENGTIVICDLQGRELLNSTINEGSNKIRFDITNLISGMYMYKVLVNDKPVQNNKLVIQR